MLILSLRHVSDLGKGNAPQLVWKSFNIVYDWSNDNLQITSDFDHDVIYRFGSLLMNTCLQMMTLGYLEHTHHSGFDRLLTKLMSMLSSLEDGIFSPLWSKAPHTRSKLDPKGGRSLCLSGQIYNLLQVQTEIAGFMFGSRTYTSNVKKTSVFSYI